MQPGYGLSLWSRVATAANTLTISASKAWASNAAAYSGERAFFLLYFSEPLSIRRADTPPGEDSRLTRAMKAYHIEKARDPSDLPPWLFEEHERRPLGRSGTSLGHREGSGSEYEYESRRATAPPRSGGRGLRDIYDAAATATALRPQETREWSRGRLQDDVPVGPPSKASGRLKELREAKRNAAQRNTSAASIHSSHTMIPTGDEWTVREERGRGYGPDRGDAEGPRFRSPSSPAGVRPGRSGVLPPRQSIRKI